jgi:hypothetical protein
MIILLSLIECIYDTYTVGINIYLDTNRGFIDNYAVV